MDASSQDLRNKTRALLDCVEAGESITITVAGRAVATLEPVDARPRWVSREEFMRRLTGNQADPTLRRELRLLAHDTTDDSPPQ